MDLNEVLCEAAGSVQLAQNMLTVAGCYEHSHGLMSSVRRKISWPLYCIAINFSKDPIKNK
jgi:hypothetical protein